MNWDENKTENRSYGGRCVLITASDLNTPHASVQLSEEATLILTLLDCLILTATLCLLANKHQLHQRASRRNLSHFCHLKRIMGIKVKAVQTNRCFSLSFMLTETLQFSFSRRKELLSARTACIHFLKMYEFWVLRLQTVALCATTEL